MTLRDTIKRIQRGVGVSDDGIFGPVTAEAVLRVVGLHGRLKSYGHQNPTFTRRTERILSGLDPKAAKIFRPWLAEASATAASMGVDIAAINGFRSWAEQDALYAKGRSKPGRIVTRAKGGQSNHNFGIAIDLGVFRGSRYLDESEPETASAVYRAIAASAQRHGIEWGGNWRRFKDEPHFQIATGLSMAEKRRRWGEHGTVFEERS